MKVSVPLLSEFIELHLRFISVCRMKRVAERMNCDTLTLDFSLFYPISRLLSVFSSFYPRPALAGGLAGRLTHIVPCYFGLKLWLYHMDSTHHVSLEATFMPLCL